MLSGKSLIKQITEKDNQNKKIILLGRTGAGKTTLAKYLTEGSNLSIEKDSYDRLQIVGDGIEMILHQKLFYPNIIKIQKYPF